MSKALDCGDDSFISAIAATALATTIGLLSDNKSCNNKQCERLYHTSYTRCQLNILQVRVYADYNVITYYTSGGYKQADHIIYIPLSTQSLSCITRHPG